MSEVFQKTVGYAR